MSRVTLNLDYSTHQPSLPNIGANFGGAGPYANYVLIATIPADEGRCHLEVENTSGAQLVLLLDDGTAASSAAPVNATVFALAGGSSAGAQGGSWADAFQGRLQLFSPSGTSNPQVAVFARRF